MAETYRIGEAAELLNLKTYVLRFWETEFPAIAPLRTEKGQRLYTREHVALLERIRFLLHDRGLTIEGARKILAEEKVRGVAYVFGAPGALAQPDPWPEGDSAEAGSEPEPMRRRNISLPVYREEAEPGSKRVALEDIPPQAIAALRDQCNLPGVEPVLAALANLSSEGVGGYALDSSAMGEYFPGCGIASAGRPGMEGSFTGSLADAAGDGPADKRMLPLFAVAKAAYLAGRAAGSQEDATPQAAPTTGGDNFIAAGLTASSTPSPVQGGADKAALTGLIKELEAVLDILKGR